LLFENYGQEVGGTNTLLVPNLKVGGLVSPVPTVVAPMHASRIAVCLNFDHLYVRKSKILRHIRLYFLIRW